jgi:hypothetical protein
LKRRREQAAERKNRFVEIRQDMLELITNSDIIPRSKFLEITVVIDQKGRALHLLNVGSKKRKRPEFQ